MARVVFDLDGTLVDSAPDLQAIANALLHPLGHAPLTLDEVRGFVGHGVAVFITRMRAARGIADADQATLLAGFLAHYDTAVGLTTLYPGVPQALAALQQAGHRLGLCTNKPLAPTLALLRHVGLAGQFAKVIAGDTFPTRKPDPAPLRAAFDMGGGGPDLYVGDSEVVAETAARADVPFLLFTRGYRATPVSDMPHTVAFDDFNALPGLIAQMSKAG